MFGERLRKMRKTRKLSQEQLSVLTKIDQSDISKMERGERGISLKQAAVLADALDVSLDYLAGRTNSSKFKKANKKSK